MKQNRIFWLAALGWLWAWAALGQDLPTQTVKGTVLDRDSKAPIEGATVAIIDMQPPLAVPTDEAGNFKLENVPIGRHTVVVQYLGYEDFMSDNAIVSSAKELVMNIELGESAHTTETIVVTDTEAKQHKPLNDMSVVSARSFSVEETQRYAASINDPSRMAMGFAGVQAGRDNNSDIIVRGNSPVGVLWRLEGVDIPNPNHFARRGSSGGGITIFSASLLSNSDFSTGAFAAEYGNAFASVFDMRFRKGNNEKREYTIRAGIIGLDFATEGPFKKGGASYLVNYRYSTLGLLNKMGFSLVGENVSNTFQDLSFNLAFPTKNKKHSFTWFGIGGMSSEITSAVADTANWRSILDYSTNDFITNMGATGVSHTVTLDKNSYLKTTIAAMGSKVIFKDDTLALDKTATTTNNEVFIDGRFSLTSIYNRKFSAQTTMKAGLFASHIFYNVAQQRFNKTSGTLDTVLNSNGSTQLLQPFAQVRYKPTTKLSVLAGVHALFLTLNATYSVEPRLGLRYDLGKGHSAGLAYGLHGRMLPIGSYFTEVKNADGSVSMPNKDLKMIKAHHVVASYDWYSKKGFHIRAEAYYQSMFNVPVGMGLDSTYWLLNDRDGFAKEGLTNSGKGLNYGLDLTVEKFFSNQFFFLCSGSLYRSLFTPLNGKTYSTRYDGLFNTSWMGGKEWQFKKGGTLQIGTRVVWAGGLRYTPNDSTASIAARELVPINSRAYELQVPNYFRIDGRVSYRKSLRKVDYMLSLDIQNATSRRNISREIFDPVTNRVVFARQAGMIPVIAFQLNF